MQSRVNTALQLAHALRRYRRRLGLTQTQAAARVGLLQKTVSALETNPERCQIESLFRLLSALELDLFLDSKPADAVHEDKFPWSP
ncbi:MAG: helix-turn-helix domain-containing protein [Planctomycetes bacterium]|jgi:HTH-type transcriptional regulator/antitoxin HipB|nr:helix-turn-helix domain-containing protein [Planctomycetota bacterium]MBT4029766.1 helix-turn-helix domain-containing protein [Planctomycetota bacterium]MBT4559843.1 helix-turn-helix domain-containing protein [Planctomycetota bacterium]MBT5102379.1 helix-turn-helix domain-containing protein [Planctomycetota bacterium]MBT5119328.1 helix-turn-helix domain-containing protein [Planctomycetota bacterium]